MKTQIQQKEATPPHTPKLPSLPRHEAPAAHGTGVLSLQHIASALPTSFQSAEPGVMQSKAGMSGVTQQQAAESSVMQPQAEASGTTQQQSTDSSVMQRQVMDKGKVVLDKFNRETEIVQTIAQWIHARHVHEDKPIGHFDDLFDAVKRMLDSKPDLMETIVSEDETVQLNEISEQISHEMGRRLLAAVDSSQNLHLDWIFDEAQEYVRQANQSTAMATLLLHEDTLNNPDFQHFNHFDNNMLWRFSSRPSTEQVFIAPNTPYEQILRAIAAHSGGNDKSDTQVQTLSFGRNAGALMGTALSPGGDPHVTNIIDKTAYLIGINIANLSRFGITAHPARGRAISLFETEYVLVCTPGDPPRTLKQLATVILNNPFKGTQKKMLRPTQQAHSQFTTTEEEMGRVEPEALENVKDMDPDLQRQIMEYALAVREAAAQYASMVREKEPLRPDDLELVTKNIRNYIREIHKRLR